MTRSKLYSLLRHAISLIGGILIARGVLTDGFGQEIMGTALSLLSVIWSIMDKTYTVNQIEGTARQLLTTLSGILIFKTALTPSTIDLIMAAVSGLLSTYLGVSEKTKPEVPMTDSTE